MFEQMVEVCKTHQGFQLPDAADLAMPTRSNEHRGSRLGTGSLHEHALRSILLEPPQWSDVFSQVSRQTGEGTIWSFGPECSIPPSLASQSRTRAFHVADHQNASTGSETSWRHQRPWRDSDIAVVGMACKVAGADSVSEFWDLLADGHSQHRQVGGEGHHSSDTDRFCFDDTAFRKASDPNMRRKWFANLISDPDQFDHRFFKKSAREAAAMDPQQRQLLQVAYQAVEQSGYLSTGDAAERDSDVGCFVGVCLGDYENNVACHAANAFTATGNLQGFIAGKVSHYFGWTGPGLTIDTACSSSLVAVHQACRAILGGECSAALAGGTHIMSSATWFQNLAAGSFLSPTGQCKPFDAKADGYCRGEGVGAVFLKKMSRAVADGDQILGVIAATAVKQNQHHTPIFVPNEPSLAHLFATVTNKARVKPAQVSVVEAHGTGTAVGDPAEYGGIRQALGGRHRSPENPLIISSVKGLVGHLECTSGIISLVKTLLMLNKGLLPPQASFDTVSPAIEATSGDHMSVPTQLVPWNSKFRVALINNYGASGSNASMVVTETPSLSIGTSESPATELTGRCHPIWLGALDGPSLSRHAAALHRYLTRSTEEPSVANISFQLARQSNRALEHKALFTVRSTDELKAKLLTLKDDASINASTLVSKSPSPRPAVVLCFGGQISTFVGLDRQLYDGITILRKNLDDVDEVSQQLGYGSILPSIFARSTISDTVLLQLALFAMQYACARSWIQAGLQPDALVGHSFGELTALCVSQVLSLQDTVRLIGARAGVVRDFWEEDKGAMVVVEAGQGDVESVLEEVNRERPAAPVSIACFNGERSFTLAGPTGSMDAVVQRLDSFRGKAIRSKRLSVTNAFHSCLVDGIAGRLEESCRGLTFNRPVIHLEHATKDETGPQLTARFVADHMRNPVYFKHALERLSQRYASTPCVFLEAGSSSTITAMASRALGTSTKAGAVQHRYHALAITNCDDGWDRLAETTLSLWKSGLNVHHWAHHGMQGRRQAGLKPLLLPPYQFDPDSRHWAALRDPPRDPEGAPPTSEATKEPSEGVLTLCDVREGPLPSALFRINAAHESYQQLLAGHQTVRTAPICPATAQISFAIEAVGRICPGYRSEPSRVPQVQDVVYHSPVCANHHRTIWVECCNAAVSSAAMWHFEVFSTENATAKGGTGASQPDRTTHTTGVVVFAEHGSDSLKGELARFQRLFGHHRATGLLGSPEADEVLANRSIYRSFAEIVDYGDEFRGVQRLASRGNESAGHVIRKNTARHPSEAAAAQSSWFDPYLGDTFCQLGGFWVNCTVERAPSDVYLANGIERWIRSPSAASGRASEFHVFATHHRLSDRQSMTDVFVFNMDDGILVEAILGISYMKMPKLAFEKVLIRLSESPRANPATVAAEQVGHSPANGVIPSNSQPAMLNVPAKPPISTFSDSNSATVGERPQRQTSTESKDLLVKLKTILVDLSGLRMEEIRDDSELADLGIDSLAGMEMVHEIESTFKVTLPEDEILVVTDLPGLLKCVAGAVGVGLPNDVSSDGGDSVEEDPDRYSTPSTPSSDGAMTGPSQFTTPAAESDAKSDRSTDGNSTTDDSAFASVLEAFQETKKLTDARVIEFGQRHYVSEALPAQNALTVALTVEAFEALGAGLSEARPGRRVERIPHGTEHGHFVDHLYRMLEEDTQVIKLDGDVITRTAVPLPSESSKTLYEQALARFGDQQGATRLIYYVGTRLAGVLSGQTDGVKLVFGSAEGRDLVGRFYAEWPLNRALYAQMEDLVERAALKLRACGSVGAGRPLRILEMGAGTGGTTRRLVPLLARLGVPVEYTFTDLAPSFVAAARKAWTPDKYPFMRFRAHDIEKPPAPDLVGTQHLVVASNAVHATRSLQTSCAHVRRVLRPADGFLLLLEMTRTPAWVDLVFGVFEGWWLFDDGRRHALAHETRWDTDLRAAGYGRVDWTEGATAESEIEKLILAAAGSGSDAR